MSLPRATRPYGHPDETRADAPSGRLCATTVRVAGLAIHHVDTGPPGERPDAPTVLLLPGVVSTHRYFRDNLGPLAERHRVIAPDLPGFGRSDKPDAPYTIDWFVDQVLALLDAKGVAQAHVAGNSLGGQIALALARRAPDRVARLVLVSPAGFMPYERVLGRVMDAFGLAAFPAVGLPRLPRLPTAALALLFRAAFPTDPARAARFVAGYARGVAGPEYPLYVRAAFRSMRGSLLAPMREVVPAIAHPTLVVWGARDRILSPAAARPLVRAMPNARLSLYERAGHCAMLDEPARWNEEVLAFLDEPDA